MLLINGMHTGYTIISSVFIDRYLPGANGEFVKVYLTLVRLMEDQRQEVTVAALADRLEHTETDVVRALTYWERQGLLTLYQENDRITAIELLPVLAEAEPEKEPEAAVPAESVSTASEPQKPSVPPKQFDLTALQQDEDFQQLIFLAETYLMRPMTPKDLDLFGYLYENLKFPADLMEYLIEYCVDGGHKSTKYMEAVALGWHSEGIRTAAEAKEANRAYSKENKRVMRAFGINGRVLGTEERKFVRMWIHDYKMPLEVVVEACNRTIKAIHQPSFEYADKILQSWKSQGVMTAERARAAAEAHRQEKKESGTKAAGSSSAGAKNRFHNFDQRSTDYDALLREGMK